MDPLSPEYAHLTPYQFASNTPIWAIDVDGLEGESGTTNDNNNNQAAQDVLTAPNLINNLVTRGSEKNAPYRYQTLSSQFGVTNNAFTPLQEWAYNKASRRNKNRVADRLFKHFLLGGGTDYFLNESEMQSVLPYGFTLQGTNFPRSTPDFNKRTETYRQNAIDGIRTAVLELNIGETNKDFKYNIAAGVDSKGTLGQFTIKFEGHLTRTGQYTYTFVGSYYFKDGYDFDPRFFDKDGLRSSDDFGESGGEGAVRKVALFQLISGNGTDFEVKSESIPFTEPGYIFPKQ